VLAAQIAAKVLLVISMEHGVEKSTVVDHVMQTVPPVLTAILLLVTRKHYRHFSL
jgi:hypothetical protein